MNKLKCWWWLIMKGRWLCWSPLWWIWIIWAFVLLVFCLFCSVGQVELTKVYIDQHLWTKATDLLFWELLSDIGLLFVFCSVVEISTCEPHIDQDKLYILVWLVGQLSFQLFKFVTIPIQGSHSLLRNCVYIANAQHGKNCVSSPGTRATINTDLPKIDKHENTNV